MRLRLEVQAQASRQAQQLIVTHYPILVYTVYSTSQEGLGIYKYTFEHIHAYMNTYAHI